MGVTDQITDALTREHHAIDAGIETFLADDADPATLREALDALRRHIYLEERFLFPPLKQSMMMPIINTRASMVTLFRVKPRAHIMAKLATTEAGMDTAAMTVDRQLRIKANTTRQARMLPRMRCRSISCSAA